MTYHYVLNFPAPSIEYNCGYSCLTLNEVITNLPRPFSFENSCVTTQVIGYWFTSQYSHVAPNERIIYNFLLFILRRCQYYRHHNVLGGMKAEWWTGKDSLRKRRNWDAMSACVWGEKQLLSCPRLNRLPSKCKSTWLQQTAGEKKNTTTTTTSKYCYYC